MPRLDALPFHSLESGETVRARARAHLKICGFVGAWSVKVIATDRRVVLEGAYKAPFGEPKQSRR